MSSLGIHILVYVFSALLPPKDDTDRDFYEVLGLCDNENNKKNFLQKRKIKLDDIKKAYRKKSLRLHPDKVAQRRVSQQQRDEAAQEYELVQEAYSILSDPKLRQRYHVLQCSPSRYRFVQNGSLMNPNALHENLAAASFRHKSRLVLLVFTFLCLLLVQPILIAVKVNHMLLPPSAASAILQSTSWVVVLIPLWVIHGFYILVLAGMTVMIILQPPEGEDDDDEEANAGVVTPGAPDDDEEANNNNDSSKKKKDNAAQKAEKMQNIVSILFGLTEQLAWFAAEILLALKWDGQLGDTPYYVVFVPIYFGMILQWVQHVNAMKQIRKDMGKMVSESYFKEVILEGKNMQDVTQEERAELETKYLVLQVPPDIEELFANADTGEGEEDDEIIKEIKEKEKISLTQEYMTAQKMLRESRSTLFHSVLFGTIFLVLLIIKVDQVALTRTSWWIIFIPIWIYLGWRLVSSMFTCCCYAPEVDLELDRQEAEEAAQNEANNNEDSEATTAKEEEEEDNEEDAKNNNDTFSNENVSTDNQKDKINAAHSHESNTSSSKKSRNDENSINNVNTANSIESHRDKKNESKKETETSKINASNDANDYGTFTISKEEASKKSIKELKQILRNHKVDISTGFIEKDDFVQRVMQVQEENGGKLFSESQEEDASIEYGNIAAEMNNNIGNSSSNIGADDNDDDDDDDNSFVFDEEEFHAWQSAYAEAESMGMEKRAKAQGTCCFTLFQIMIVCLFVAKLNDAYHYVHDDDHNDRGFNALWILFPILFITGIIFCCCACLIYCSGSGVDKNLSDEGNVENENEEYTPGDTGTPIIIIDNHDPQPEAAISSAKDGDDEAFIVNAPSNDQHLDVEQATIPLTPTNVTENTTGEEDDQAQKQPLATKSSDLESGGDCPSDENSQNDALKPKSNATNTTATTATASALGSAMDDVDMYDLD